MAPSSSNHRRVATILQDSTVVVLMAAWVAAGVVVGVLLCGLVGCFEILSGLAMDSDVAAAPPDAAWSSLIYLGLLVAGTSLGVAGAFGLGSRYRQFARRPRAPRNCRATR